MLPRQKTRRDRAGTRLVEPVEISLRSNSGGARFAISIEAYARGFIFSRITQWYSVFYRIDTRELAQLSSPCTYHNIL